MFEIDPDIRKASTPPGALYGDPAVFQRQRERLFPRSWHFAIDDEKIKTPGQAFPWMMLPGCLDEPVLFTRDHDGAVHALSNACTHRGNIVVEGACHVQGLRCRYHGRRFGLDGAFHSMPEFEGAENFPTPADDLPRVPLGAYDRFLFTSLSPAVPFDELVAPMRERLSWVPWREFAFDPDSSRDYLVNANWALYCDNYLEGFHIPYVHPALARSVDYATYRVETLGHTVLQIAEGEPAFDLPAGHPDRGRRVAAYYFWLFPATMFNLYAWGLSINAVVPLAPDRTRVVFLSFVWDEKKRAHGAGSGIDRVEREDEAIVESVQLGVRSRLYRRGRYSPSREAGVHHFHRLLARHLD